MLIWWPYAQISPIANPIEAIRANAKFSDWPFTVLYAGNFIRSFEPPWHYLPTWFAITLPEFYGIALGGALGALIFEALAGVTGQKKGRKKTKLKAKPTVNADLELQSKTGFLWFAILFPILTAIGMGSILYDGNRHFLFVIPPLAVLAGCALAWLWDRAGVAPYQAKVAVSALAGISALLTVHDMIALHPYQSTYFNRVFGGLKAAAGRYETDYWGASHQEGIRWLAENYLLGRPDASIRVANTSHPAQTEYLIRGWGEKTRRFLPVSLGDSPNVVLSTTRWNRHEKYAGKILHTVVRDGVPLLYVIEVNGG